jgi:hypothetical protein
MGYYRPFFTALRGSLRGIGAGCVGGSSCTWASLMCKAPAAREPLTSNQRIQCVQRLCNVFQARVPLPRAPEKV